MKISVNTEITHTDGRCKTVSEWAGEALVNKYVMANRVRRYIEKTPSLAPTELLDACITIAIYNATTHAQKGKKVSKWNKWTNGCISSMPT